MDSPTAHYTVLARRFRPQTFSEVVGQQHVAQSLQNAIRTNRVAHAYLFTGARGVGKTSMARILAKTLNCPNAEGGVPCHECDICRGIAAGNDVDVLEIDGASNRGIDDVRQLRANVGVKSMRTHFKVYIIDEVHMLTREAFNALLKTLEEPPPNVKFVFCTTEPNKVPDTILSRCQRFDFSTIETQNIVTRLHEIAEIEGYEVEPAALELVARRAAGSMRDSQSLFDQLLAFGEERITPDDVHRLLGTADDERLIALADALIDRRRDVVLQELDRALGDGVQLDELVGQLLSYLRDLMVLAAGAENVSLLSVSSDSRPRLEEQAQSWGVHTILAALEILSETRNRMFRASYARTLAETALVRISLLDDLDQLGDLIETLKQGGDGSTTGGGTTSGGSRAPQQTGRSRGPAGRPSAPARGGGEGRGPRAESPLPDPTPQTTTPHAPSIAAGPPPETVADSSAVTEPQPALTPAIPERDERSSDPSASPRLRGSNQPEETSRDKPDVGGNGRDSASDPSVAHDSKPSEPSPQTTQTSHSARKEDSATPPEIAFEPGSETRLWSEVLSRITDMLKDHASAAGDPAISGPNQLALVFPRSYHFSKQYCERPTSRSRLEQLAEELTGRRIQFDFRLGDDDPHTTPAGRSRADTGSRHDLDQPPDDPLVRQALEIFGAKLVRVETVTVAAPDDDGETRDADEGE